MPALDKLRRIGFHNSVVEASHAGVSGDDEVAHLPLHYLKLNCPVWRREFNTELGEQGVDADQFCRVCTENWILQY